MLLVCRRNAIAAANDDNDNTNIKNVFLCQPTSGKSGSRRVCPSAGPHSNKPSGLSPQWVVWHLADRRIEQFGIWLIAASNRPSPGPCPCRPCHCRPCPSPSAAAPSCTAAHVSSRLPTPRAPRQVLDAGGAWDDGTRNLTSYHIMLSLASRRNSKLSYHGIAGFSPH